MKIFWENKIRNDNPFCGHNKYDFRLKLHKHFKLNWHPKHLLIVERRKMKYGKIFFYFWLGFCRTESFTEIPIEAHASYCCTQTHTRTHTLIILFCSLCLFCELNMVKHFILLTVMFFTKRQRKKNKTFVKEKWKCRMNFFFFLSKFNENPTK